jgi:hypothetical protein
MVFGLIRKIQCVGLPCLGRVYCTVCGLINEGYFSTVCGLIQEDYFVQCVDYFRRAFWMDWAYLAVYLYSVWNYLGRVFCTIQCVDLSGRVFCTVYGPT